MEKGIPKTLGYQKRGKTPKIHQRGKKSTFSDPTWKALRVPLPSRGGSGERLADVWAEAQRVPIVSFRGRAPVKPRRAKHLQRCPRAITERTTRADKKRQQELCWAAVALRRVRHVRPRTPFGCCSLAG